MSKVEIEVNEIEKLLPHRPPFLFVDRVLEIDEGRRILAERTVRPEEPYFVGHFPGEPIMPGVLITEAPGFS
jgi:3-hydroxyacyl-[acyl-carrier-protein] dehydratase